MSKSIKSFNELQEKLESKELSVPEEFMPDKTQQYNIVSKMAFLLGIDKDRFGISLNFDEDIYNSLNLNKNARILRNLNILRNDINKNFTRILAGVVNDGKSVLTQADFVNQKAITELTQDGVKLLQKGNAQPNDYMIDLNTLIQDRLGNCKSIFPEWLNWEYVKDIFIMPQGKKKGGVKNAGEVYRSHKNMYPYQAYINWKMPHEDGNILLNDKKFVTLLYKRNHDYFNDINKVIDVSDRVKTNIYDFIDEGENVVMIVDCENSDVFNLISMLQNLEWEYLQKIKKIILVDDEHTTSAWAQLDTATDIPIEHITVQRVKEDKSLVDGIVISKAYIEHYENKADTFLLLSSDSDFWALISQMKEKARFLLMIEHIKSSPDYIDALMSKDIMFCYLDEFNSGEESENLKKEILLKSINEALNPITLNVKEIFNEALNDLRIGMDQAQKDQFYKKYIAKAKINIDAEGLLTIKCAN